MTDRNDTREQSGNWNANFAEMSERYFDGAEQSLKAQAAFTEAWLNAVDETVDEETMREGFEGSLHAYEAWIDAAEATFDRTSDALEGDDVDITEFRDIWLNAANEAFKELMVTEAFAAMAGQSVENSLDVRRQFEKLTEESLGELGMATESSVHEVGERLVELERRQHEIERKLDRVLEQIDDD